LLRFGKLVARIEEISYLSQIINRTRWDKLEHTWEHLREVETKRMRVHPRGGSANLPWQITRGNPYNNSVVQSYNNSCYLLFRIEPYIYFIRLYLFVL
jgi:hypothetical protein